MKTIREELAKRIMKAARRGERDVEKSVPCFDIV
jgi:hypothetical protein